MVYVPSLAQTKEELKKRMTDALMNTGAITHQNVYNELNYNLNVSLVIKGAHIEHL